MILWIPLPQTMAIVLHSTILLVTSGRHIVVKKRHRLFVNTRVSINRDAHPGNSDYVLFLVSFFFYVYCTYFRGTPVCFTERLLLTYCGIHPKY